MRGFYCNGSVVLGLYGLVWTQRLRPWFYRNGDARWVGMDATIASVVYVAN